MSVCAQLTTAQHSQLTNYSYVPKILYVASNKDTLQLPAEAV